MKFTFENCKEKEIIIDWFKDFQRYITVDGHKKILDHFIDWAEKGVVETLYIKCLEIQLEKYRTYSRIASLIGIVAILAMVVRFFLW